MKLAKRDYRRNGILYRTINGTRKKFGKLMTFYLKVSTYLDTETAKLMINKRTVDFYEQLKRESGLNYIMGSTNIGLDTDDELYNIYTIRTNFFIQ